MYHQFPKYYVNMLYHSLVVSFLGPMPPRPGPYGPPLPVPPMMGGPQNPMAGPSSSFGGAPNTMAGPPSMQTGPPSMQPGPQNMQTMPPNAMNQAPPFGSNVPQSSFQNASGQPPNFMNAPPTTANAFMNQQMPTQPTIEASQNQVCTNNFLIASKRAFKNFSTFNNANVYVSMRSCQV